jgi:hypothetical protein
MTNPSVKSTAITLPLLVTHLDPKKTSIPGKRKHTIRSISLKKSPASLCTSLDRLIVYYTVICRGVFEVCFNYFSKILISFLNPNFVISPNPLL